MTRSHMWSALQGLSVGDALGHRFNERTAAVATSLMKRQPPPGPWRWTDDTLMACSIVELLADQGRIDPDALAASFARRYEAGRGYGPKMRQLLDGPGATGALVRSAASRLFDGAGSFGNGAVMRVAPLGAFFADDPGRAASEGAASAVATHTHPEAVAGASAVAVAGAMLAAVEVVERVALFDAVLDLTPASDVRGAVERAARIDPRERPLDVARRLRADRDISCQATTPFCLWVAARRPDEYEAAVWDAISVGGDRDTHAAVVGGLLGGRLGEAGIPPSWLAAREALPAWLDAL